MKKARILAGILAAVAVISTAITVSAESIAETAKTNLEIGKNFTLQIKNAGEFYDYKLVIPKDGTLTVAYEIFCDSFGFILVNDDGNFIPAKSAESSIGEIPSRDTDVTIFNKTIRDITGTYKHIPIAYWNSVSEKGKGTIIYKLDKGTYYLRAGRGVTNVGLSKVKLGLSLKDLDCKTVKPGADTEITDVYVTIPLAVGGTLQLSATTKPAGKASTWKSSDKSVITVSSKGLVTGVAKGTASVTVTSGSKSQTVYFKVG